MAGDSETVVASGTPAVSETAGTVGRNVFVAVAYGLLALLGSVRIGAFDGPLPIALPAGFAMAAILVWGWRCWVGVVVGAFLAALAADLPGVVPSLAVPVAVTAALQALVGAGLARPWMPARRQASPPSHLFLFLIMAGPVACSIGGAAAVIAEYAQGARTLADLRPIFVVHWAQNALGVLLLVPPLLYALPGSRIADRAQALRAVIPLLLTAAVLCSGHVGMVRFAEQGQIDAVTNDMDDAFEYGVLPLKNELQDLLAVERLFAASERVSEGEFAIFCRGLFRGAPIAAVDWAPRVPHEEIPRFVRRMRAAGYPDYGLFGLDGAAGVAAVGDHSEHFPVAYTCNLDYGSEALGLDHAYDSRRRMAMANARDKAQLSLTAAPLIGSAGTQILLAFVPVYERGFNALEANVAQRREALNGFVVGVFEVERLFRPLIEVAQRKGLYVRIVQRTSFGSNTVLVETPAAGGSVARARTLSIGGVDWDVQMRSAAGAPYWVTLRGMTFLLSSLLVGLLAAQAILGAATRNAAASALVAERTANLARVNHDLLRQRRRLLIEAEQRRRAEEMAQAANRAKSAFLATMSHEIRTPMNGVVGLAEVLQHSHLMPHQRELVATMTQSAKLLLTLIDDILDFSKIEAGRLELDPVPLNLEDVIDEVCDLFGKRARDKSVLITSFVSPAVPDRVLADGVRLRQIVANLVSNAIKFSDGRQDLPAHVAVRVDVLQPAPLHVALSVADSGIGMSPEQQARLFQPFSQAEASTTRRFGGTGLGLAICRRLVDAMKGEIRVDSAPSQGATFTVTLPLAVPEEQPERSGSVLDGIACLIVDGSLVPAGDLCAYLEAMQARADVVDDLAQAAARAVELLGGHDVMVVVHDARAQAPDLDALNSSFAQLPGVRHVALTRGRRRRPRVMVDGVVTMDLDGMRRSAFLEAVAVAGGRLSASRYVFRADEAKEAEGDSSGLDLGGVECVVAAGAALDAARVRQQLERAGGRVSVVDSLDAAACEAGKSRRRIVVIHDAEGPQVSLDGLHSAFPDPELARHVVVTRGRRRKARIVGQQAVTLDSVGVESDALLEAVAVAAGRASPGLLDQGDGKPAEWNNAPSIEAAAAQGRLILVAEDDPTNQKVIRTQLGLLGFAAEIAENGAEALRMWRDGQYALLLADLHMPAMDGYELTQAIREEELARGERLPIIALTANTLRGEADRASKSGMDGYLTKPLAVASLQAALEEWLPHAECTARREGDVPPAAPPPTTAVLDVAVLKRLVGDDPATVQEMLVDYRKTLAMRTEQLRDAHGAGDCQALAAAAHPLKSSSRSVGAMALGARCEALETAAKAGDAAAVAQHIGDFEHDVAAVEEALAELIDRSDDERTNT